MKHPKSHIPFLLLALAITVVVAALYAYMYYATASSVRQANLARDIVAVEGANQSQASALSELATSTSADRARLASFFVPADGVVAFITALESLGPQSGSTVSIASIDADALAKAPAGTLGAARARINARGSWASVMRTLALAERMPYAVSIDHVQLDSSGASPSAKASWSLSFDIQAAVIVVPPGQ